MTPPMTPLPGSRPPRPLEAHSFALGGGRALDVVVRACIGAGRRQVNAGHWPAPREFDATKRLFPSFFSAGRAVGMTWR